VLNGQGPLLVLTAPGAGMTTGADIRQSRFNFSVSGPQVFEATPRAVLEIDLFGMNGPGGFGEVSIYPRVRLAYAELTWASDVLRFGQDHQLIIPMVPDSLGHQAFPSTYFNGMLGWREPGIGYFHTIPIDRSKLELSAQVLKSDWENPSDFGSSTLTDLNVDLGQLSGWPGVEARAKFTSDHLMAFAAGHWNHVDGSRASSILIPAGTAGVSSPLAPATVPNRDWDVVAGVAGFKVTVGGLSLLASAYVGKNLGPLLGEILQFPVTNDVHEWGGWSQLGYEVVPHLTVSVIGGLARPNAADIEAAGGGRADASMAGAMIRYQLSGFSFGPEYYHLVDTVVGPTGQGAPAGKAAPIGVIEANQLMATAIYTF
jgi:hypothetical protein